MNTIYMIVATPIWIGYLVIKSVPIMIADVEQKICNKMFG